MRRCLTDGASPPASSPPSTQTSRPTSRSLVRPSHHLSAHSSATHLPPHSASTQTPTSSTARGHCRRATSSIEPIYGHSACLLSPPTPACCLLTSPRIDRCDPPELANSGYKRSRCLRSSHQSALPAMHPLITIAVQLPSPSFSVSLPLFLTTQRRPRTRVRSRRRRVQQQGRSLVTPQRQQQHRWQEQQITTTLCTTPAATTTMTTLGLSVQTMYGSWITLEGMTCMTGKLERRNTTQRSEGKETLRIWSDISAGNPRPRQFQ